MQGSLDALSVPNSVAIDRSYARRLGVKGIGDAAEISDRKAEIRAVTKGIWSFTTTPYVFTPIERARLYTVTPGNKVTYLVVHLDRGADLERVRSQLRSLLSKAEVLTPCSGPALARPCSRARYLP